MSTITRWAVTENPDDWGDAPTFDTYAEAKREAITLSECVICLTYTFDEQELVDDFRADEDEDEDEDRASEIISIMPREKCVKLLAFADIKSFDSESIYSLRDVVLAAFKEGLISEHEINK